MSMLSPWHCGFNVRISSRNDAPVSYQFFGLLIPPGCKAKDRSGSKNLAPPALHMGTFIHSSMGTSLSMCAGLPAKSHVWMWPTQHSLPSNMLLMLAFTKMSESISRNPSSMMSHSFCTLIMCLALPNSHPAAHPCPGFLSGNLASSFSKSMICPLVLSITSTFFIFFTNGRSSLLSKMVI